MLLLQLPPLLPPQPLLRLLLQPPLLRLLLQPPLLLLSPQVLVAQVALGQAQSHCAAVQCLLAYGTDHCLCSQT
jgi:hypothetical protein